MKVIETMYNGYRFRSRLEARWAVFFDTLGIRYEYEKEGYELDNGVCYLPDFWLPALHCWIEIKAERPTYEEAEKARLLAKGTQKPVFILYGELKPNRFDFDINMLSGVSGDCFKPGGPGGSVYWSDTFWLFTECSVCGRIGLSSHGRTDGLCSCIPNKYGDRTPRILKAYEKARQAQFEHNASKVIDIRYQR